MAHKVPGPQAWPFIGNMLDLRQGDYPLMALNSIADQYGPVYNIKTSAGTNRIVVSSQRLVNELCDEKRFEKLGGNAPSGPNNDGKPTKATGLFFARNDDPDWGQAHRILLPAFGPLSIEAMFDEMHDIARQMALTWARRGPDHKISVTDDFTRLTLDSIALCAMDYRFNSFYQETMHPYVDAMTRMLGYMGQRNAQLPIVSRWQNTGGKIEDALEEMTAIARELVQKRKQNPNNKRDLLNAMLNGVDPKTSEKMRDELIMANMNTFLVAGHETTSGLLSFAMYLLLKHPAAYKAVQEEVDRVVGKGALQSQHLKQLKYITAVLRETLRLHPTAAAFTLKSKEGLTFTLGDYVVEDNHSVLVLLYKLHRDPEVYGDDAELFRPERMLDEHFNKLPPNSWKPFGNGQRSCIGRAFALQEATMALAISFQRFNFRLHDPSYDLKIRFNLTLKPQDLYMHATLRDGLDATDLERALHAGSDYKPKSNATAVQATFNGGDPSAPKLKIFYGSNTGTCEALSQRLLGDAAAHGYVAEKAPLDSINGSLPQGEPIVILCPSYEGQPPDNAIHFVAWLQGLSGEELKGVRYVVYGCGHHDWVDTFHRIPKLIDSLFAARGATRIIDMGLCDVAEADVIDRFDEWKDNVFWPTISKRYTGAASGAATGPVLDIEIATDRRAKALQQEVGQAAVLSERTLTMAGEPEKRHLEIALPSDMTYKAGDYLAVLPLNPGITVRRVMARFGLPWDAAIKLSSGGNITMLPSNRWMPVHAVIRAYVELSQPPSKKDLRRLIELVSDGEDKRSLEKRLASGATEKESHVSILDLLERHPSVALSFSEYLTLLPPLRVRLYSISSSPLHNPSTCSISYTVVDTPDSAGWSSARHPGVASSYLASLRADDQLHVQVRPSRSGFKLPTPIVSSIASINSVSNGVHHPSESASAAAAPTPIIMICAGTGLAPFRAFVQERALQLTAHNGDAGRAGLGAALLFIGCRTATADRLYSEELDAWVAQGAVSVRYAFSRDAHADAQGCKYVQHRVKYDKAEFKKLWDQGGKIYICGASALVKEVANVLREVLFLDTKPEMAQEEYAKATRAERIVTDVFG